MFWAQAQTLSAAKHTWDLATRDFSFPSIWGAGGGVNAACPDFFLLLQTGTHSLLQPSPAPHLG